jgi:hypothetical protein
MKPILKVWRKGGCNLKKKKTMITNTITLAKKQLEDHAKKGANSNLSIFEAARLMDVVKFGNDIDKVGKSPIFFNFSQN